MVVAVVKGTVRLGIIEYDDVIRAVVLDLRIGGECVCGGGRGGDDVTS